MPGKSYCITVNPTPGLDERTEKHLLGLMKKHPYYTAWTEKTGKSKHMHYQIWCATSTEPPSVHTATVRKSLERFWKREFNEDEIEHTVFTAYACSDWYKTYGYKDDGKLLARKVPEDQDPYYRILDSNKKKRITLARQVSMFWEYWTDRKPPFGPSPSKGKVLLMHVTIFLKDAHYTLHILPPLARQDARMGARDNLFAALDPENAESLYYTKAEWKEEQKFRSLFPGA